MLGLRHSREPMEVPFSGFELAFIVVAFVVFSFFSVASVCIRPDEGLRPGKERAMRTFEEYGRMEVRHVRCALQMKTSARLQEGSRE